MGRIVWFGGLRLAGPAGLVIGGVGLLLVMAYAWGRSHASR